MFAVLLIILGSQGFTPVIAAPRQACDSGWLERNGLCYYIGTNVDSPDLFSWHTARSWCLQNGGDLATIRNEMEKDFFANKTQDGTFTGGVWIGYNKFQDGTNFVWSDGDTSTYTDWALSEPSGIGKCTYQITHPKANCFSRLLGYNTISGLLDRPNVAQPPRSFSFGYLAGKSDEQGTIDCEEKCHAQPLCQSYTFISNSHPIGTWMGECLGTDDLERIRVVDVKAFGGVRVDCGVAGGRWFLSNCGNRQGFICQKVPGNNNPVTVPPTSAISGFCPAGYFESQGNKCFKVVEQVTWDQGYSWADAQTQCKAGPGVAPDFASIQSAAENAVIAAHLAEFSFGYWIGLSIEFQSSRWTWADNMDTTYTNWAQVPAGTMRCAEMRTDEGLFAMWKVLDCSTKRGHICQTYKDGTAPTPAPTIAHSCKSGYTNYGSNCYKVVTTRQTWFEASKACEAEGTYLASIRTAPENAAILVLAGSHAPLWMGYTANADDEWSWTDHWQTFFTNWQVGEEPGSGGGCGLFKENGKWKDADCTQTYGSVCRISSIAPLTTPSSVEGYCPDTWVEYANKCYFFSKSTDGIKSYDNAKMDCQNRAKQFGSNGTLVSINHRAENEFVYQNLKAAFRADVWIGLYKDDLGAHHWTDGSAVEFMHWAPGEPNDGNIAQKCVEMYINLWPGLWNDHTCFTLLSYACKADKGIVPTTPYVRPGLVCPPGCKWKSRGLYCYYIDLTARLSFEEAQVECTRQAGRTARLAVIPDLETNQFLMEAVKEETGNTFGNRIWIGLVRKGEEFPWRWLDGSDVTYASWAAGEPNNQNEEHCGEFVSNSGEWNDMHCVTNKLGFICRVSKESISGSVTPSTEPEGGADESVYRLSHSDMSGVVLGTMLAMTLFIVLAYLVYLGVTGSLPATLSKLGTGAKFPPIKRKSVVNSAGVETAGTAQ